ncbi:MAG: MBL fold metallo-hydrolase [Trueperaceae bacterium]|nr:MAG: MBL fold metallo-hydrolase [Trueperaceae bacterium]
MAPSVDVIIQPVCLRFRYHQGEIVYLFSAAAEQQLDAMESMVGIDPQKAQLFDANLGFLPVASTVLIRGEKTVLVDPGNHHIGFYGMLGLALGSRGLSLSDIDVLVTTHTHADHAAAVTLLPNVPWVLGRGEFGAMAALEGQQIVEAKRAMLGPVTEVGPDDEHTIMEGVTAVFTPGHTPGHISLLVETASERVLVAGDLTMTESEYRNRTFSHWYGPEQLADLNASLDRVQAWGPTRVIPGHDRAFNV